MHPTKPVLLVAASFLLTATAARAVTTRVVATGLASAHGNDYVVEQDRAYVVDRNAGEIWRINLSDDTSSVIGTGYTQPMDIAVASGHAHAYVVENGGDGTLLHVDLANANRAMATVVATNITAPSQNIMGQIALDETNGHAYVVQNAGFGVLWRIDLQSGAKTSVLEDISIAFGSNPSGILLTEDSRFAYFTTLGGPAGKIWRLDLVTSDSELIASGLTNPSFMDWAASGQSEIYVTESTIGQVSSVDISVSPAAVGPVVTGLPDINVDGITAMSERLLLISDRDKIIEADLSPYDASGPIILGIGHVPFDRIFGGYANTTGDPGYFFQVRDAAFGGTLSLMINHVGPHANPVKARWYQVLVDGVDQRDSWRDFRWNGTAFVLETMDALLWNGGYYFPVRDPGDLWYNPWLGYRLNTVGLSNGPHTITVRLFRGGPAHPNDGMVVGTDSLVIQVDNTRPTVSIESILHGGSDVGACGIVDSCPSTFEFRITARDGEGHLRSWQLTSLWGENCSDAIVGDNYLNHLPGPLWSGPSSQVVPAVPWEAHQPGHPNAACAATSCDCAHTFELRAWGRVINGYSYIQHRRFHSSVTLLIPCPC